MKSKLSHSIDSILARPAKLNLNNRTTSTVNFEVKRLDQFKCDQFARQLFKRNNHYNFINVNYNQITVTLMNGSSSSSDNNNNSMEHKCSNLSLTKRLTSHRVRTYDCYVCDKTFKRSNTLQTHLMIHNNVKPFSCSICLKAFRQKSDLKKHMYTHTGTLVCFPKLTFNFLFLITFHLFDEKVRNRTHALFAIDRLHNRPISSLIKRNIDWLTSFDAINLNLARFFACRSDWFDRLRMLYSF